MRSKNILVNNNRDYNKLLRKINLYKSILYCKTIFIVENKINEENIDYIINALNIKNRRKRIEYIYDQSCYFIDEKVKNTNICGFKNGKCYVQRKLNSEQCNGCCRKCIYQTKNGCSTKNLSCKLFNYSEVTSRYKVIRFNDLKILKILNLKNRFIIKSSYFSKREDVLNDLYSYSIIYSTFRIIYRLIKTHLNFKKISKFQ